MILLRNRFTATCLAILAGSLVLQACAQDYVDVEAERAAAEARRAAEAERAAAEAASAQPTAPAMPADPYGVQPAQAYPATSYGLNSAPANSATTAPGAPAQAQGPDVANIFFQVQQLQQELMRLQGIVEEQGYELRTLKQQSLERYVELDRRLSGGSAGVVAAGAASAGAGVAEAGADAAARPAAVQPAAAGGGRQVAEQPGEGEAYRAAYALVRGQQFDQAVTAFRQFLQEYPAGRYAPNAHYWLGELYLVIEPPDLESSRQSFMLLLSQYPDNSKVPDALYKLGKVHFLKGNREKAREYLDQVIREYGDGESSAAQLAREFIDENY